MTKILSGCKNVCLSVSVSHQSINRSIIQSFSLSLTRRSISDWILAKFGDFELGVAILVGGAVLVIVFIVAIIFRRRIWRWARQSWRRRRHQGLIGDGGGSVTLPLSGRDAAGGRGEENGAIFAIANGGAVGNGSGRAIIENGDDFDSIYRQMEKKENEEEEEENRAFDAIGRRPLPPIPLPSLPPPPTRSGM